MTNIFVISSWYPSVRNPVAGIFVKEQLEALACARPQVNFLVSLWGHDSTFLPTRKFWQWPFILLSRAMMPGNVVRLNNGLHEIFSPKITWSKRLPFGGAKQLINVNRENFELAQKRFGKISLIHAHVSYPAGFVASILSKEFGVPFVVTEHMSPFPFPELTCLGKPIDEISIAFNSAAASIAVSPALACRIESFGFSKPTVVPNMVDGSRFYPKSSSQSKTIFFTLCGITEQKGIGDLLDAIALWDPPSELFEFRIGGDGPLKTFFQDKAEHLGLVDRVKWLGAVSREQAPALYQDCDVFVLPSLHETFGVVYAEAIATGKPLIATKCGGPESIVTPLNGVLVDVGDVKQLSAAMRLMAENLDQYDPLAIRADFEARFSSKKISQALFELYGHILKGH